MNAVEFIKQAKNGSIDLEKFYSDFFKEVYKIDKKHDCFITISEEEAFKQLKTANKKGKLYGLPVSVKDCVCTKGIKSTAGSRMLHDYKPEFDATIIRKIKQEGGIIIGKTCMDEFGFGTFCTNCAFKIPKNPFDTNRSCGGSSGGAACITQAITKPHIAIAESTGGSISCPASFCGVVGLTPTYGRVSRYGMIDYASSMDKIGTMSKTVIETAYMMNVIAGFDEKDQTTRPEKTPDYTQLGIDLRKVKIGVPKECFEEGVNEKVNNKVWEAIKVLESNGAEYEEFSLETLKFMLPTYYIISLSEASTNLSKLCGIRYGFELPFNEDNFNEYFSKVRAQGFGREAKRRIILGTFTRMSGYRDQYYLKAMKMRTLIINDFKKAFKKYDIIAKPAMPVLPPRFDEIDKMDPVEIFKMDLLTTGPNLAGIPMISMPCGMINSLPVGLHLVSDHLEELKLLKIANSYERMRK